jgi:hypothetical protein
VWPAGKAAAGPPFSSLMDRGGRGCLVLSDASSSAITGWRRTRIGPPDPVFPRLDPVAVRREVRGAAGRWAATATGPPFSSPMDWGGRSCLVLSDASSSATTGWRWTRIGPPDPVFPRLDPVAVRREVHDVCGAAGR